MNPRSEMFRELELCLEWWTDRSIRVQKIPSTRVEDGTVIASAMPSDWELIQDPLIRIIDVPVSREVRDEDGLQVITYTGPACRVVIRARVEAASGSRDLVGVQFEDVQEGNVIVAESAFDISRHGESRSFKPCSISQSFEITSGEGLFGLGQQRIASVNMRNRTVNLVQENTIISIPFLVSTGGYGLLWEQTAASTYSNEGNQVTFSSDRATGISYWFIRGTSFDQVINEFRILTGKASLLPLWAFGFIQGRNRYWTRDEVISVVERHRKMHLPIDMIFIDYMYYGKWGEGSHRFDEASFPDPAGMIRELHEKFHVKLLLSVWPNFSPDADTHHEMDTNGYLLDCKAMGGSFYDPFNHDAGKAFWSLLERRLLPLGVDAWWLDASEPDNPAGFLKARTEPGRPARTRGVQGAVRSSITWRNERHGRNNTCYYYYD